MLTKQELAGRRATGRFPAIDAVLTGFKRLALVGVAALLLSAMGSPVARADVTGEPIATALWNNGSCNAPSICGSFGLSELPLGTPPATPAWLDVWDHTVDYASAGSVALSPDGETLAATLVEDPDIGDEEGRLRVVVMGVNGSGLRTVLEQASDASGYTPPNVEFSPDGASLVVTARYGDLSKIQSIDLESEEVTTLVEAEDPDWIDSASWSADGSTLLYMSWTVADETATGRIVMADPDGATVESIDPGIPDVRYPRLSPDGTKIAFGGLDEENDQIALYVMDLDDENSVELVGDHFMIYNNPSPEWSPDGEDLLYMGENYGEGEDPVGYDIKRVSPEGGTPTVVMEHPSGRQLATFALRTPSDLSPEEQGDALLDQLAADYYVDEYGGTEQQAKDWLDVQDRSEGLGDRLEESLPADTFGGAWFDNVSQRVMVAVTSSAPSTPVDAALDRRNIDAATDTVTVDYSIEDLQDAQPAIDSALDDLIDDGLVTTAPKLSTNSVEIDVATAATTPQRALIDDVKDNAPVRVTIVNSTHASLEAQALSCDFPHCDAPLRGGVKIRATTANKDNKGTECSAGFMVRSKSDRKPYVLTAGHCMDNFDDDESTWEAYFPGQDEWVTIGDNHNPYIFGDDGDAGLIAMDPFSLWRTPAVGGRIKPYVYVGKSGTGSTQHDPTYRISGVGTSVEGRIVCTTGAITGSSCGKITGLDMKVKVNAGFLGIGGTTVEHLGRMHNCTPVDGDSGGPVIRRHRAYGILSAGGDDCEVFFQSAARALSGLNVSLVTRK